MQKTFNIVLTLHLSSQVSTNIQRRKLLNTSLFLLKMDGYTKDKLNAVSLNLETKSDKYIII